MKNYIRIKKKYLIFRDEAKKLAQLISKKLKENKSNSIYLDFTLTDFMSRSFIDEFLNQVSELERKGINIQFVQLASHLRKFIVQVKKTKNKIKTELSAT